MHAFLLPFSYFSFLSTRIIAAVRDKKSARERAPGTGPPRAREPPESLNIKETYYTSRGFSCRGRNNRAS